MTNDDDAMRLLAALREAGSHCFVDDGQAFFSPPRRHVEWHCDAEEAIEELYSELLDLLLTEHLTIH